MTRAEGPRARPSRVACFLLISVALTFVNPRFASAQRGTAGGFHFGPAFVGTGIDTGISTQGVAPFRGQVISIAPTIVTYNPGLRRSTLSFEYEPRVEIYTSLSELNALNHRARGTYSTELSRNLTLQLNGNFLRSKDRSLQLQTATLAPRGQFTSGLLSVGTTYQLNVRTSLDFRAQTNYTQSPTLFTTAAVSIKQLANTAFAGVTRTFASAHSLTLSYVYQTSSVLNLEEVFAATGFEPTSTSSRDSFNAGYAINTRSQLYLQGAVGVIRRRQGFGDEWSYSFNGTIRKVWQSVSATGTYQRTLSGFLVYTGFDPAGQPLDPLLESRVAQRGDFALRANLGRRVQLTNAVAYTRTEFGSSALDFINANVAASVRASDRVAPFVSFIYLEQRVPDAPAFRRARILLGLSFFWEPTPIGSPIGGGVAGSPRGPD